MFKANENMIEKPKRVRWWKAELKNTKIHVSGVYSFVFPDGSRYIGGSKDVIPRIQTHLSWLRNGKGQTPELLNAYKLHGEPKVELLVICQPEDIRTFEYLAFDVYVPTLCKKFYGGNAGVTCSEQARKNMSDAAKRKDQMCQSKRQLETWADPVIRQRRLEGMKRGMLRRKKRHGY